MANIGLNRNFVNQYRMPFQAETIAEITGIGIKVIRQSIREIANDYGKSRQVVFVYLEAMASIGMVGIKSYWCFIITREGVLKLGTSIQPGILGNWRNESGIKPKPGI
ncbi:MAG: hypothetical protein RBS43_04575 [Candidatus Cloacimonas sp.]|jgi:hypothetical protein|nr:hypothetical protein [Candidatus Cloacimonas sp.]